MNQARSKSSDFYGRQLLYRIIPIFATICLLYWLMGGLPPLAGQQLVLVLSHFSLLRNNMGAMALVTLVLLAIQVLLIGAAWFFLIWLLVREIRILRSGKMLPENMPLEQAKSSMQPQANVPSSFSPRLEVQDNVIPDQGQPDVLLNTQSDPISAQISSSAPTQSAQSSAKFGILTPFDTGELERLPTSSLEYKQEHKLVEDFKTDIAYPLSASEQTKPAHKPVQIEPQVPSVPASVEPQIPSVPLEEVTMKRSPSPKTQLEPELFPSVPSNNPFDVQPDVLDLFHVPGTMTGPTIQSPFRASPTPEIVSHEQVPQIMPIGGNEEEDEEDDPFVFGNPFEGPLPDVFHQDSDLRKSIQEHTGQKIEEPVRPIRTRKKRIQKPSSQNE